MFRKDRQEPFHTKTPSLLQTRSKIDLLKCFQTLDLPSSTFSGRIFCILLLSPSFDWSRDSFICTLGPRIGSYWRKYNFANIENLFVPKLLIKGSAYFTFWFIARSQIRRIWNDLGVYHLNFDSPPYEIGQSVPSVGICDSRPISTSWSLRGLHYIIEQTDVKVTDGSRES